MIITIGREHGSNGHIIARKLAEELGYVCYDKEIVEKSAENSIYTSDVFKSFDERKITDYISVDPSHGMFTEAFSISARVATTQFKTIKELAESDNCIFVGRCADYILRERENLVRVFINADDSYRIENLAQRYSMTPERAKKLMKEVDKDRSSYYRYYTDQVWGGSKYYDVCVNSGKIGVDGAVAVIKAYVEALNK